MSLYFDNVRVLAYQHTSVFFGIGLRYRVQKVFTIEGTLLELQNTEGVNATWTKAELLNLQAQDYQPLILNGVNFGTGKVTSIHFIEGNHVQQQKYNLNIECYSDGDLSLVANGVYQGINWTNIKCIESLDETLTFSLNEANDKTYDHTISLRFERDVANLGVNPINLGKAFTSELLNNVNFLGFLGDYNSVAGLKKVSTESYNEIDFSCSVSQRLEIPNSFQGTYSISFEYSLSLSDKGITTISEKSIVQGLTVPLDASASAGFTSECGDTASYDRSNTIYGAYAWSSLPLHSIPFSTTVTKNKFDGKIDCTRVFTNDPHIFNYAFWDRTITISRTIENYYSISEKGSVRGLGRALADKFPRAKAFYDANVIPSLFSRISAAYLTAGGTHSSYLVLIKTAYGEAQYLGTIDYERSYTDNNQYVMTSTIKKEEITVETSYPVHVAPIFGIFNHKTVIQPQNTSTPGSRNINVKLKGARGTSMADYLTYAKALITSEGYQTIGTDSFISAANYSLGVNQNDFNLSVHITFFGFYKAFETQSLT